MPTYRNMKSDEMLRRLGGKVRKEMPDLTQEEAVRVVVMMTSIIMELWMEMEMEFPGETDGEANH